MGAPRSRKQYTTDWDALTIVRPFSCPEVMLAIMSRSTATYTNTLGVPLANQPVVVLDRYKQFKPVVVYSDPYGVTPVSTTNGSGVFTFYAPPGDYSLGIGIYRFNATVGPVVGDDFLHRTKLSLTNRASTVTVAADPELVIPVNANTTYRLDALLFTAGPDTADLRMTFTGPSGTTIQWTPRGPSSLVTGDPATLTLAQQGAGTEAIVGLYSVGAGIVSPRGLVIVGATAGNVSLAWAQGTTNAVPVGLSSGSWMALTKIRNF